MFLSVKEMEVRKVRFDETFQAGQLDLSDQGVRQIGPLSASGTAELLANTEGEVRIQGRLKVEIGYECDRCLGQAVFPMEASFDLFYQPASVIGRDEEIEIDEGEAEIGFYENGGIELEDVLREQVLLALPMQRVCREECLGICPVCGRNRNETDCECRPTHADDRWATLRDLATEK
jgi:uncharacterized protein